MNKQIKNVVKKILEEDEYARGNDDYLILKVVQELRPELSGGLFATVMLNLKNCNKDKQITFEGITRARRKLQELYPNLRGNAETEQSRKKEEENYHVEYGNHIPMLY